MQFCKTWRPTRRRTSAEMHLPPYLDPGQRRGLRGGQAVAARLIRAFISASETLALKSRFSRPLTFLDRRLLQRVGEFLGSPPSVALNAVMGGFLRSSPEKVISAQAGLDRATLRWNPAVP